VPEADAVVSRRQRGWTAAGAEGMPAHVTLLIPFADSTVVDERLADVREALRPFRPFECTFEEVAYFERPRRYVYLRPEPREILVAMIEALVARFPEFPPYDGEVEGIVPHLSVAAADDEAALRAIGAELEPALPIRAQVREVSVVEHVQGAGWREHTSLPLG
jgi:2'-5' RNA ligase